MCSPSQGVLPTSVFAALRKNIRELDITGNSLFITTYETDLLRSKLPNYVVLQIDAPDARQRALELLDEKPAAAEPEDEYDDVSGGGGNDEAAAQEKSPAISSGAGAFDVKGHP